MIDRSLSPNNIPWPPLILVGSILGASALHDLVPMALSTAVAPIGIVLIVAALIIDVTAMITMARARTTIMPHHGSQHLITTGIFKLSRNPIYVANVMIIVGYGLWSASLWPILVTPIAAYAMQKLAIEREEAHLEANFGDAFAAYKRQTRRWI